jgi:hypothetical protein
METATSLEPTDGPLTVEELQLATRNRGMPLEAMAYDLTPTGLHYLLIHFDIPVVDRPLAASDGGQGAPALTLSLAEIRLARARRSPSRWSVQATAEPGCRRGRSASHGCWRRSERPSGRARAGGRPGRGRRSTTRCDEVVFTGADRGVQGGRSTTTRRSLSVADATRRRCCSPTR